MAVIEQVLKNEVYGTLFSYVCVSCLPQQHGSLMQPSWRLWVLAVEAKAQHWVDAICTKCMADLHELNKPFKYIVTAAIVQKNGAGFHAGHSAYWDSANDNLCQVAWPTEKMREQQGSRIRCVVTAFGLNL